MRLDKCDVYTVKETLGCKERKTYVAAIKGPQKQRNKWRNKPRNK